MDWTLSLGDFLRAGIIVYVGIWTYLRFRERIANKNSECDVYKVTLIEIRTWIVKSLGWIIVLLIGLARVIIFPEVYVIIQDKDIDPDNHYSVFHLSP